MSFCIHIVYATWGRAPLPELAAIAEGVGERERCAQKCRKRERSAQNYRSAYVVPQGATFEGLTFCFAVGTASHGFVPFCAPVTMPIKEASQAHLTGNII